MTGASPAACCNGIVEDKALEEKSSTHGDLPDGFDVAAAAGELAVEVPRMAGAERSTGARELNRLAVLMPRRSFRDAIAAGQAARWAGRFSPSSELGKLVRQEEAADLRRF